MVVIRLVRVPDGVVLVVKIPADGFRLRATRCTVLLLGDAGAADRRDSERVGAAVSGGWMVIEGIFQLEGGRPENLGRQKSSSRSSRIGQNPDCLSAAVTGQRRRAQRLVELHVYAVGTLTARP